VKDLNIGEVILRKRKEAGLTQETLADFMGVSKASVSKWETGASYPDIVVLPQLASYFDISLDELMGYERRLTGEDVKEVYEKLTKELAGKSHEDAREIALKVAKKYYSCYPLLFQIGVLILNHGGGASSDEDIKHEAYNEAKQLFERVKNSADSVELKRIALQSEALCELTLKNPQASIALLESESHITTQLSTSAILALSYQELDQNKEAKMALQESILDSVIILIYDISSYLSICEDDMNHFEEACKRAMTLADIFNIQQILPVAMLTFYLSAAEGYIKFAKSDRTLDMLHEYSEIAMSPMYPLKLRGDEFFNFASEIEEKNTKESSIVMPESHGSEISIKENIVNGVVDNPKFESLAEEPRYEEITNKLKAVLE
jgi:transcriptional regulator with XRE-family HTH domain